MRGMIFTWLLTILVFQAASALAQSSKLYRIGFLAAVSPAAVSDRLEAFRQGLRELGYAEGKNYVIEGRYAEGKLERFAALAAELVRLKVDVILSGGPSATGPARKATATIPIVMGFDSDPVGNGYIASLARPGGNITGLSSLSPELSGKQLELLKEILPALSRVVVIGSAREPANAQALREAELAAGILGIKIQNFDVQNAGELDGAFRAARKGGDAALVLTSPFTFFHRAQVAKLAREHRVPAMYWAPEFVEAGGLMTYSVSFNDLFRRAATYVDKIFKGAKPADLPVQQPTKFELVINLKAAKQIGLTIPPQVLARADRVIR